MSRSNSWCVSNLIHVPFKHKDTQHENLPDYPFNAERKAVKLRKLIFKFFGIVWIDEGIEVKSHNSKTDTLITTSTRW